MASPFSRNGDASTGIAVSTTAQSSSGLGTATSYIYTERPVAATQGAETASLEGDGCPGDVRSKIARFKSMTPSRLPIPRSPCLTIPPGLSPTTLLDSPILLSTGQAELSPTTGTFPFPQFIQGDGSMGVHTSDSSKDGSSDQDAYSSFHFNPFPNSGGNPMSFYPNPGYFGFSHQHVAQVHAQTRQTLSSAPDAVTSSSAGTLTSAMNVATIVAPPESTSVLVADSLEKFQAAQMPAYPLPLVERPSEDGFNWRKYGQKQVKGSEYPRSYYKCTYPSCPVKKKVERSYDGQVTEIVYKGEHNHPKPPATRRSAMAAAHFLDGGKDGNRLTMPIDKAEGSHAHIHSANGNDELMSSVTDPSRGQLVPSYGGGIGTPEPSSGSTSNDEAEDGDDDEPDSKRRKREKANEMVSITPLRTVREARVVVQTTSEVDILDDGYRWRKYGQKVVKGNPHPRSYYRCTNFGCSVRKHVERSSTDLKAVITTYEGKHNHDVPASRNSSHDTSGSAATCATATSSTSGPGHTELVSSSMNAVAKPSASLQDQFFLGKLLEDMPEIVDRKPVGLDLVSGGALTGTLASDGRYRNQGGVDISSEASMSLLSTATTGLRRFEGSESFGQGLGFRPKQEQDDNHYYVNPLQSTFSSSSSFCEGMTQRLVLGP